LPGLEGEASMAVSEAAGTAAAQPQAVIAETEKTAVAKAVTALADEAGKAGDDVKDDEAENTEWVRWVEVSLNHVRLHSAPLSVAHAFSRYRPAGQAWVLTSATLAVRSDISQLTPQPGLTWE